jgi:hypothetical protein
MDVERYILN